MKTIEEIKSRILPVLRRYKVRKAALFGSVVRGETYRDSDVDILVDLDDNSTLLDFVGLKLELEDVLQLNVDLVEYDTIKPLLRDWILRNQEEIL